MLGPERKARPLADIAIARPSAVEAVLRKSAKSMPAPADSASDPAAAEAAVVASKKALAADLEGVIQGMLRTTQFATAATARTRTWSRQIGEVAALDASTDDSAFTAQTLNNLLWVTFTRSNPAADVHGIGAFTQQKHWGCAGPLVIDARLKPHHAPPLQDDPDITRRVEALAAPGKPLHRII